MLALEADSASNAIRGAVDDIALVFDEMGGALRATLAICRPERAKRYLSR